MAKGPDPNFLFCREFSTQSSMGDVIQPDLASENSVKLVSHVRFLKILYLYIEI